LIKLSVVLAFELIIDELILLRLILFNLDIDRFDR